MGEGWGSNLPSVGGRLEPISLTCLTYTLIIDSHQPLLFNNSWHRNIFNILVERTNMTFFKSDECSEWCLPYYPWLWNRLFWSLCELCWQKDARKLWMLRYLLLRCLVTEWSLCFSSPYVVRPVSDVCGLQQPTCEAGCCLSKWIGNRG